MKRKSLFTILAALVLVGAIGVGATLAYFTDADQATNVITMGNVDIDLDEPNYDPDDDDNIVEDIIPGQVITKDPTTTVAEGSADAYVRAMITLSDNLDDTQKADLLKGIEINDGWVLNEEDGYYYYQEVLSAGEKAVLFDEVVIPAEWGNEIAGLELTIDVAAEAIQADNFTPETVDGVVVGWDDVTVETYSAQVEE